MIEIIWRAGIVATAALGIVAPIAGADLPQERGVVDLGSQANLRIDSGISGAQAGVAVAGTGDLDLDGFADVLVGAIEASPLNRHWAGSAFVVFGSASPGRVTLDDLGGRGFRIDGATPNTFAGISVGGLGDVNGDGRGDLVVGSTTKAFVVFGKSSWSGIDLADLGSGGYEIDLGANSQSARPAGDVNGDGLADVVVGGSRRGSLPIRTDPGVAYVVFGKQSTQDVDVTALGTRGFRIEGANLQDWAGTAVDAAGDVNGDGYDDVILGAPGADNNLRLDSGSAYVVFGKPTTDVVDLASLGPGGFRIDGAAALDSAGGEVGVAGTGVAGAGDLNGDGLSDVLVGARLADNNLRLDSGSAYLVFGKRSPEAVDLAALGARGFRIDGAAIGDAAGGSVSGAGDLNGDGTLDVLVGAAFADNNARTDSGSAYAIFGGATAATVDLAALGTRGFRMDGADSDDFASSVSAAGDVNGDERADVIVGAQGANGNAGAAYVVYGFGP